MAGVERPKLAGAVGLVGEPNYNWDPDQILPGNYELDHVNELFAAMERVIDRMSRITQNQLETRHGGIMIVYQEENASPLLLTRVVGEIEDGNGRTGLEKKEKYTQVAFGKLSVLVKHPDFKCSAQNLTDLSPSSQVAAGGVNIPGGGIRFADRSIVVLSGFGTPEEDECAVLAAKVLAGDLSRNESVELARSLGNNLYPSHVDYLIGHKSEVPASLRAEKRYGRTFGDSIYISSNPEFYELLMTGDFDDIAMWLAWSHACPIPRAVIDRMGPKAAAEGYAELNLINSSLLDIIKIKSLSLYRELTSNQERGENEPSGKFETESVPQDHSRIVRGPAGLAGYILPRLVREFLGPRSQRNQDKFISAYQILEQVVDSGLKRGNFNPEKLVVDLANAYIKRDKSTVQLDSWKYLRRLLSQDKYEEDNQYTSLQTILSYMRASYPRMWKQYLLASVEELKKNKVVDLAADIKDQSAS